MSSDASIEPSVDVSAPPADSPQPVSSRPPRKKREPILSLEEYFSRRAAKPGLFLKDLREAGRWQFDPEDAGVALATHADRDKDFRKTTQLVAAAAKERDAGYARPVIAFAAEAMRVRLAENPHFKRSDFDAAEDPDQRLRVISRALAPRVRDSKRRTESANVLLCAILCWSYTDGLSADVAIEALLSTLNIEPSQSPGRERSKLVWLGERPRELKPVLELLAPSVRRANELGSALPVVAARADTEHERRVQAEAEVVSLEGRIADLESTVSVARREVERLEESARAAGVHADHDVKRDRARIAGLLDGQLRDLVATIDEALSVDPVQVDVAREKAEVVMREIERQVQWLRS